MRRLVHIAALLSVLGCEPKKEAGGTSKAEITKNAAGETVRKMTIRVLDGTLSGLILPDTVKVTAQGLDDNDAPVALADGTVDMPVTVSRFSKWIYRAGASTNNYADIWTFLMLDFELPVGATKWKVDLSQIPNRSCTPEPAVVAVSEVPDVTDKADKTGSEYALTSNCKYTYKFSATVSGLNGDLKLIASDQQEKTISAASEDTVVEFTINGLSNSSVERDLTAEEITEYNKQSNFDTALLTASKERKRYFSLSIGTNPEGQTCEISNASKDYEVQRERHVPEIKREDSGDGWYYVGGVIPQIKAIDPSADVVTITCVDVVVDPVVDPVVTQTYSVGGTVSGLTGGTLKLKNYETDELLDITADGTFLFTEEVASGLQLDVRALVHPSGQFCELINDYASEISADVTDIIIICDPAKRIMTSDLVTGDMGGIAGADMTCDSSASAAGYSGTWEAFLVDGTVRKACTNANCVGDMGVDASWVMAANMIYYSVDSVSVVGTTNANGIFEFDLTNALANSAGFYYTGLEADWTASADNCTNWTDDSSGFAAVGVPGAVNSEAIYKAAVGGCPDSMMNFILCVEQ
jgi:hypothetical protein